MRLRVSPPILGLWTHSETPALRLEAGTLSGALLAQMGLLSTDGEGIWILLRTGLPRSSETRFFSFRYFCSLGQKVRRDKSRWGIVREGGRSEGSVIFTQLSGGLSLSEAGNNFKAVTSPCYFARRLVLCLHRQAGPSTYPS